MSMTVQIDWKLTEEYRAEARDELCYAMPEMFPTHERTATDDFLEWLELRMNGVVMTPDGLEREHVLWRTFRGEVR